MVIIIPHTFIISFVVTSKFSHDGVIIGDYSDEKIHASLIETGKFCFLYTDRFKLYFSLVLMNNYQFKPNLL
jgi:hypothetical protein